MSIEDVEKAKKEIASSNDNQNKEQKITDIGYLYLSQQMNNMMQMLNEFRNNIEIRFDNQRQEFKSEIKTLSDKVDTRFEEVEAEVKTLSDKAETDTRFNKVDDRFDKVDKKFDKVDERFDKVDERFGEVRTEIKTFSDKTDSRFDRIDTKFDDVYGEIREIRKEISGIQRWAFALIVTVILGFVAIYFK